MKSKPTPVRHLGRLCAIAILAAAASCITVNVNFPESAVQRAADDFVRDLYKGTGAVADANASGNTGDAGNEAAAVKASVKKAPKKKKIEAAKPTTWYLVPRMLPEAHAQEIDISTPKAKALLARMKSRVGEIVRWKQAGILCEAEDGTLGKKDIAKAGADAGQVSKLVQSENADRDDLYEEVQTANRISDPKQKKIRSFFAAAFRKQGPPSCE